MSRQWQENYAVLDNYLNWFQQKNLVSLGQLFRQEEVIIDFPK
jgi:hypothetical protein